MVHNYCNCQLVKALQCKHARKLVTIVCTIIGNRRNVKCARKKKCTKYRRHSCARWKQIFQENVFVHKQQKIANWNIEHMLHMNPLFDSMNCFILPCKILVLLIPPPAPISITLPFNFEMEQIIISFFSSTTKIYMHCNDTKWTRTLFIETISSYS
jgi:hypothetical protein